MELVKNFHSVIFELNLGYLYPLVPYRDTSKYDKTYKVYYKNRKVYSTDLFWMIEELDINQSINFRLTASVYLKSGSFVCSRNLRYMVKRNKYYLSLYRL